MFGIFKKSNGLVFTEIVAPTEEIAKEYIRKTFAPILKYPTTFNEETKSWNYEKDWQRDFYETQETYIIKELIVLG